MLMTKITGFPGSVGFCTFLDCDPSPSFSRRELHSVRLEVGEWRFPRARVQCRRAGQAYNSLGQDPCTVVQTLQAKCENITCKSGEPFTSQTRGLRTLPAYDLQSLRPGTNYLTPQKGEAPGCSCNTVTYSSVSLPLVAGIVFIPSPLDCIKPVLSVRYLDQG